jgi:hypothetical protein
MAKNYERPKTFKVNKKTLAMIDKIVERNERTSARVAKIAAKVLATKTHPGVTFAVLDIKSGEYLNLKWTDVKAMAASCLTQTSDHDFIPKSPQARKAMRGKLGVPNSWEKMDQRHKVRVKAEGFDRVLTGPVELMKPRATGAARIKSKKPSSWPSQRVLKRGP